MDSPPRNEVNILTLRLAWRNVLRQDNPSIGTMTPAAAPAGSALASDRITAVADFAVWTRRASLNQKLTPIEPPAAISVEHSELLLEPGLELFAGNEAVDVGIKR